MNSRSDNTGLRFVMPALILIALIWVLPLFYALYISFTNASPGTEGRFVGIENFLRILQTPQFFNSILISVVYALGAVVLSVGFGILLAVIFRKNEKGKGIVQSALLLPWVLSELAVALIWNGFLDENIGLVNTALARVGVQGIPFMTSTWGAMTALWIATLWRGLAFSTMLQMAGLASLPENIVHAAKVDGAGRWLIFRWVLLPHQWRILAVNALLVFMTAVSSFSLPFALTGGGPLFSTETVALFTYRTAFSANFELGLAAAAGMVMLAGYGVFVMFLLRLRWRTA